MRETQPLWYAMSQQQGGHRIPPAHGCRCVAGGLAFRRRSCVQGLPEVAEGGADHFRRNLTRRRSTASPARRTSRGRVITVSCARPETVPQPGLAATFR
jgi:hypothetical protein